MGELQLGVERREDGHLWTGRWISVDGKYEVPKEVSLKRNVSLKGLGQCGIPQIDKLVWTSPKLTGEEVMVPMRSLLMDVRILYHWIIRK